MPIILIVPKKLRERWAVIYLPIYSHIVFQAPLIVQVGKDERCSLAHTLTDEGVTFPGPTPTLAAT